MSAEQFWKDDPQLFNSYRISFINKKKREMEELDYKCWLQGLYIHDGNGKLFFSLKQHLSNIVASMFKGKKDTSKIETYPKKPYTEIEKEKQEEEKKKKRELDYEKYRQDFIYFATIKQRYLDNLEKKGE